MKEHSYTVRGSWPFPQDMLRRDQSRAATPLDQELINRLSGEHAPDRAAFQDININLVGPNKPCTARWESFGWAVPTDEEHAFYKRMREEEREREAQALGALIKLTPAEREAIAWFAGQYA